MGKQSAAEIMVEQLAKWGVKRVYGLAGDANLYFLDALAKNKTIEFIQVRHEAAAAFMAGAEAKLTGEVGVCTGTSGPGLVNMLNGLADAAIDQAPVLAITGQVATNELGMPVKQYLDQQVMVTPLTLWSSIMGNPEKAAELTWLGLYYAQAGGGVAHLSVPKDLWKLTGGGTIKDKPRPALAARADHRVIEGIIEKIDKSQKPVIFAGRGIAPVKDGVREFAEKIKAPLIRTLPVKGLIPEDYYLNLGGLGQAGTEAARNILKKCDLILILGATWWPQDYVPNKTVPMIQIDAAKSHLALQHPAVEAVYSEIALVLPVLLERVKVAERNGWLEEAAREKNAWQAKILKEKENAATPVMPQFLMAQLEKVLPPEVIICLDVGDHVLWYDRCFWGKDHDLLISGTWRSMGFGLPAAIAAKSVCPERPVLCITGDGGLTMTLGEMITAAQQNKAVKMVVINNGTLAMEENRALAAELQTVDLHLLNPDFVQIGHACMWDAARVEEPGKLAAALKNCLASSRPSLVDVKCAVPMPAHTNKV